MALNGGVIGTDNKPVAASTVAARVVTFNSSGEFVTGNGNPVPTTHKAHVLVIGGGGGGSHNAGGGAGPYAGGGGGGGFVEHTTYPLAVPSYAVTIGAGGSGSGASTDGAAARKGSDSVWTHPTSSPAVMTADGGGGGAPGDSPPGAGPGGSGAGAS